MADLNWRLWTAGLLGLGVASGLTAVSAFGMAAPQPPSALAVVPADAALVALIPGIYGANAALIADLDYDALNNGALLLDFSRGALSPDTRYGMQPASTYAFRDLVIVENNSGRSHSVRVDILDALGNQAPEVDRITGVVNGAEYLLSGPLAAPPLLGPGDALFVSVRFNIPAAAATGARLYQFRVHSS